MKTRKIKKQGNVTPYLLYMTAEKPRIILSHPGKLRQFASIARRTKNHSLGKLSQRLGEDSIFRGFESNTLSHRTKKAH